MRIPQAPLRSTMAGALAISLSATAGAQISFTSQGTVATGQDTDGVAMADLDGDGNVDFAIATDGNGNQDLLEIYRGNGTGSFTLATSVFLPNSASPQGVAAADVDGDGDGDLVVVLRDFNQLALYRNNGGFSFGAAGTAPTSSDEPREVQAGDMDGDGDIDFVVSSRDSNDVSVILNQGGSLAFGSVAAAGMEPRDLVIGDFNGDGFADVAVAAHDSRQIRVLQGTGTGALAPSQTLAVPGGTRPEGMAAADMDGDGDLDLVAGTGDDNNVAQNFVSLYTNAGGTFTGPIAFGTGGLDAGDVVAADFDADGDIDVAVANETSGSIAILGNAGGGSLTLGTPLAFAGQPDTLVAADIDGNGSADLGATRNNGSGFSIFLSDSSGGGQVGSNYCSANPNSSGQVATMAATGSNVVSQNNLTISTSGMPANTFGIYVTSQTPGFVANAGGSQGNLCLAGAIGRFNANAFNSGASGTASIAVNLAALPTPSGSVAAMAGETWHFQAWFRDVVAGQQTSNFSDGLSVTMN